MGLEQNNEQQYREVVDKYVNPVVSYQMTTRDYVVRPSANEASGAITITLPPVAEAKGRFYSILARLADMTNTITITSKGDDEEWEGDAVLYAKGQGQLFYSDGITWCLRTFADIEVTATPRAAYFQARTLTGEATAVRGRGEAAGATSDAYGVHAQGVAYTALTSRTVNALYAEAIIKGSATVTTIRGAMITCNAESTGHTITNMIGAHIRTYTVTTPSGYYRTLLLTHEKFGANPGIPLNEYIKIEDVTFTAVQTAAAYGLRMLTTGIITNGISLESPMVTGISITGATTNALVINSTATTLSMDIDKSSALTTGSIRAADITLTMTAASNPNQVEALRVQIIADVKTGAWANVVFAQLDYVTSGLAHGVGAVFCAELSMPASSVVRGTYYAWETEIDMPTGCIMNANPIGVMSVSVWGGAATQFDDVGLLFDISGVTSGATDFWYANAVAFNNCDGFLKIRIGGVAYYIPVSDNQAGT